MTARLSCYRRWRADATHVALLICLLTSDRVGADQASKACCPTLSEGRYAVGVDAGAGVGTYEPYGMTRIAIEVRLWNRLDLSANLRLAFSGQLWLVGPAFRVGVLLHLSDAVDMLVAGEAGYGAMQLHLPLASPWVHQAVFRSLIELRLALPFAGWELRATPLAATAFWSRVWGLVFEPAIGCAYRF